MARRPCLTCGNLTTTSHCTTCTQARERTRTPRPTNTTRDWNERQRRAAAVNAWRTTNGDWCPGWRRPAHPATDLTADHTTAVAAGGHPNGPLTILCRACNGAKGTKG